LTRAALCAPAGARESVRGAPFGRAPSRTSEVPLRGAPVAVTRIAVAASMRPQRKRSHAGTTSAAGTSGVGARQRLTPQERTNSPPVLPFQHRGRAGRAACETAVSSTHSAAISAEPWELMPPARAVGEGFAGRGGVRVTGVKRGPFLHAQRYAPTKTHRARGRPPPRESRRARTSQARRKQGS
jgi:hypothetical protein